MKLQRVFFKFLIRTTHAPQNNVDKGGLTTWTLVRAKILGLWLNAIF